MKKSTFLTLCFSLQLNTIYAQEIYKDGLNFAPEFLIFMVIAIIIIISLIYLIIKYYQLKVEDSEKQEIIKGYIQALVTIFVIVLMLFLFV